MDVKTFGESALESGAKKVGESVVNRALNAVMDYAKQKYGESRVLLGSAFERYLLNATERYNKVRTLATGTEPRAVIGENNIYVNIGVRYKKNVIDTQSVEPLLSVSRNLLILGAGGSGKSMLMRYLFMKTAYGGEYIPILLELRKVDKQTDGEISLLDLIYNCLKEFDAELPREQFEYSLRLGRYVFLLDGFDEVKEALAADTATAIQTFCGKYPNNACIITSRPRQDTVSPLETFTAVETMPLSKQQAIELAEKTLDDEEKTAEFCRQLDEVLYDSHRDFAENPLLLSMMFLTFMRNNTIPDHLAEFYQKCYDALYSAHDSHNKGYFRRDFRCGSLDESRFKMLFAHFCFHTYFREIYEFRRDEIISLLETGIAKLGAEDVRAEDYLHDLRDAVCMIIQDGNVFRFSHRSFQTYFAAYYTVNALTDEQQKGLFGNLLQDSYFERADYYTLLVQLQPDRFLINALETGLRDLIGDAEHSSDPDKALLLSEFYGVSIRAFEDSEEEVVFHEGRGLAKFLYESNLLTLFQYYVMGDAVLYNPKEKEMVGTLKRIIEKQHRRYDGSIIDHLERTLYFRVLDSDKAFTDEDRDTAYEICIELANIPEIRSEIKKWLSGLDANREALKKADFISSL